MVESQPKPDLQLHSVALLAVPALLVALLQSRLQRLPFQVKEDQHAQSPLEAVPFVKDMLLHFDWQVLLPEVQM